MKGFLSIFALLFGVTFFFFLSTSADHKTLKVGVLSHASITELELVGFKQQMTQYGYVEGKDIVYIYHGATGSIDALDTALQQLIDDDVDLIVTLTGPAALAAKKGTQTIPVLFMTGSDPVRSSIVESIQYPGGNVTGVTFWLQEIKRLEWLLKMIPDAKTIYIPYNSTDISPISSLFTLKQYAKSLGVKLLLDDVRSVQEMETSFMKNIEHIDAVFLPLDALIASNTQVYLEASFQRKIPISGAESEQVKQGALMSYGFDFINVGRQAARIAKEIFAGVPIEQLPVEHAEFQLSINIKSAKKLGITVAIDVLKQAEVYNE